MTDAEYGAMRREDHATLAVLAEQVTQLKAMMAELRDEVRDQSRRLAEVEQLLTRGRGAVWLLTALSAAVAVLYAGGPAIRTFLRWQMQGAPMP